MSSKKTTKDEILQVVVDLLKSHEDFSSITVRDIAKAAHVNVALISYYFQSKENLVFTAAQMCMNEITSQLHPNPNNPVLKDPIERLKKTIIDIADFAFNSYYLSKISISQELNSGSIGTGIMILPVLKEIFQDRKTDLELKLVAMQIIVPCQVVFLCADKYQAHLYKDVMLKEHRDEILLKIIDNVIY